MAIDTKHDDLQSLRIDRTQRSDSGGEPPAWARRYILGGVAVVILLGLIAEVQTRIYFEARGKPPYKVKSVTRQSVDMRPKVLASRW